MTIVNYREITQNRIDPGPDLASPYFYNFNRLIILYGDSNAKRAIISHIHKELAIVIIK